MDSLSVLCRGVCYKVVGAEPAQHRALRFSGVYMGSDINQPLSTCFLSCKISAVWRWLGTTDTFLLAMEMSCKCEKSITS